RDAAEAVLTVINANTSSRVKGSYDYATGSYDTKFVEVDDSEQSVHVRMYYSQESYAASKQMLTENTQRKNAYEQARREYEQNERDAQKFRDEIDARIEQVRTRQERVEFLTARWREYVGIAGGDGLMAMQFLAKAHHLSDEDIAALREVEARAGRHEIDQVPEAGAP
ncbi:MAG: hypothetical protein ACRDVZ_17820, partial [Jiangellaceae bacterium]